MTAASVTTAWGIGRGVTSGQAINTTDVSWHSDDPHLSGNFLPVAREVNAEDLRVVAGRIPSDLNGAYMRNGPNPLFKPISYTYPIDGDGMIHAVFLNNGKARYRNRFVQTNGLAVERRAGKAVYGGFARPVRVDPALLHPGDNPGPFKNGAFINILRHAGHLLALNEATTGYEITAELETIGEWKASTDAPIRLGAHNRHHPRTGAMFALAYSWREPIVEFHQIDSNGKLVKTFPVTLAEPTMIHDFVLTENYIVLLAGPAIFDADAARRGESMLQWRPSLGMRIAVISLDGTKTTWLQIDPFYVFHFANAFERKGQIVVDYVRHERLNLAEAVQPRTTLHRMNIDLSNRTAKSAPVIDMDVEFPRVNDRREALSTRFVYVPTLTNTLRVSNRPSATFNTLLKVDTENGKVARHDFGNRIAGEAVFVPKGSSSEDDGYLAVLAYDPVNQTSDFVLLDATHIDAEPVAIVRLPQRVPQGLHGNWIPNL
jgi:carotenoid cleavage dioxygenase-like enzyme